MVNRIKPLYIVVNPVGSKFAKAIQQAVRARTSQRVLRVSQPRPQRQNFRVTPNVLDKIRQFEAFTRAGVSCPKFTTRASEVKDLGSKTVFARTLINSTNGRGIVEFELGSAIPAAPLYTAYIPKKYEFRVHVFGGTTIDIQQKLKKRGFENERDTRVRNLHNGYVYCRGNINPPGGNARISNLAVQAVSACGYQYGAVDVIYNEKQDQYYVLEVNSRPGLMGTTTEKYADALVQLFNLPRRI